MMNAAIFGGMASHYTDLIKRLIKIGFNKSDATYYANNFVQTVMQTSAPSVPACQLDEHPMATCIKQFLALPVLEQWEVVKRLDPRYSDRYRGYSREWLFVNLVQNLLRQHIDLKTIYMTVEWYATGRIAAYETFERQQQQGEVPDGDDDRSDPASGLSDPDSVECTYVKHVIHSDQPNKNGDIFVHESADKDAGDSD